MRWIVVTVLASCSLVVGSSLLMRYQAYRTVHDYLFYQKINSFIFLIMFFGFIISVVLAIASMFGIS